MSKNKKSKKGILILLLLLLLSAVGANVWQWLNKPDAVSNEDLVKEATMEADSLIQSLNLEKETAIGHIDSLEQELSYWKNELEIVRSQASQNGMDNNERNRLLGRISSLRNRIAAFAHKEQLLDSLSSQNLAYELVMAKKADSLILAKQKMDSLKTDVTSLSVKNIALNDKLEKAGKPVFSSLVAYGMDEKKKGNQTTFDASKIEDFFVEFRLIGSPLFKGVLEQELKVRVRGPEGELYQKGGTVIPKPRSQDFTFLESNTYRGNSKGWKLMFSPIKKMSKGKYTIELLSNGEPIQEIQISLH